MRSSIITKTRVSPKSFYYTIKCRCRCFLFEKYFVVWLQVSYMILQMVSLSRKQCEACCGDRVVCYFLPNACFATKILLVIYFSFDYFINGWLIFIDEIYESINNYWGAIGFDYRNCCGFGWSLLVFKIKGSEARDQDCMSLIYTWNSCDKVLENQIYQDYA